MPSGKYKQLSIETLFYQQIEDFVRNEKYGYTSVPEFVRDAVRRRMEELKKIEMREFLVQDVDAVVDDALERIAKKKGEKK